MILYFSLYQIVYFLFSIPTSFSLCFPITSLFFLLFFLKPVSSVVESILHTIYIHSMYDKIYTF